MLPASRRLVLAVVLLSLLTASGSWAAQDQPRATARPMAAAALTGPVTVVAAGDIACAPRDPTTRSTCRDEDTAALARRLTPDRVLALGDEQYQSGSLWAFRRSYDASWGALRGITLPVPGNHEYRTSGAAGYYSYFARRQPGAPGYYARDLGRWRLYLLNSNCDKIDCTVQAEWFRNNLNAHPTACSLVTTHHPRYSSGGSHGSDRRMRRFFRIAYRHRVEMFLSGHEHHYERFRRMNHRGQRAKAGVIQFVSGAGGKSLYAVGTRRSGSAYVKDNRFGVLELTLRRGSFDFAFRTVTGRTPDSGSRRCR